VIEHDFLVIDVFRELVKHFAILDGPLVQLTLVVYSQLLVLNRVSSLPSVERLVQIALHQLCSLFNEPKPVAEQLAHVHVLAPLVEHLRHHISLLVVVLHPSDRFEQQVLLGGSLRLEGPFQVIPVIALIFEEIFNVSQLTFVVEVLLSNWAFLIELFGK